MEAIDNVRMQELALRSAVACRCHRAYLHDMRGGLQSIASSFELLTRAAHAAPFNQALAAKAAEFFRRAVDSHEQVLGESLMQICGRDEPERSALELGSQCASVLKFLQNDAAVRRVTLQPEGTEQVVVRTHAGSLRLLLLALLTHAIDHATAGASIRVVVEYLPRARMVFIASQWAAEGEGFGLIRSVGSRLMAADGGVFSVEPAAPERVTLAW